MMNIKFVYEKEENGHERTIFEQNDHQSKQDQYLQDKLLKYFSRKPAQISKRLLSPRGQNSKPADASNLIRFDNILD